MKTVFGNLLLNTVFTYNGIKWIKNTKRSALRMGTDRAYFFGLDEKVIK